MKVFRSLAEMRGPAPRAVVSIGVFDGVHAGHREILGRAVRGARAIGGEAVVLTFDPHPRAVLQAGRAPRLLTPAEEKFRILESLGVGIVVVLRFDRRFAATPADEFIRSSLAGRFRFVRLVIGYDFRLGRGREGNGSALAELGGRHGFEVEEVRPRLHEGRPVKSTWIRDEIEAGRVAEASDLLLRFHSLAGRVADGEGRGRALGYPTANLSVTEEGKLWPADGVYAAFAEGGGALHRAVVNVGVRPTFGAGRPRSVEAHLLRFDGDLSGAPLALHFAARIRGERRFASAGELAGQIGEDCRRGEALLGGGNEKYLFTRF